MTSVPTGAAGRAVRLAMIRAGSLLLLLLLWEALAALAASRALPPPHAVFAFIAREAASGDLLSNIGITLARVAVSFTVAMAIGCAIGIAFGRLRRLDAAFDTWLVVLLNTPALVLTVLCYIWLGLTEAAAILAVALNKIPTVAVLMREGARALSAELDEMAGAFRLSPLERLRHVMLPQLQPHIAGAARSGLALVWKIVLVVELLGRPNGVGYAISVYFQLFDVTAVLGYSLAFMAVMLAIEYGVLQPYETHVRRWRLAPR